MLNIRATLLILNSRVLWSKTVNLGELRDFSLELHNEDQHDCKHHKLADLGFWTDVTITYCWHCHKHVVKHVMELVNCYILIWIFIWLISRIFSCQFLSPDNCIRILVLKSDHGRSSNKDNKQKRIGNFKYGSGHGHIPSGEHLNDSEHREHPEDFPKIEEVPLNDQLVSNYLEPN